MPRGTQFGSVVDMLRAEIGASTNPSQGQSAVENYKYLLRRTYRRLHTDFNWPHLVIERTKTLQAGERYYDFPADLDFDRLIERGTWIREAGEDTWYPMIYGIDIAAYNTVDSYQGEREDFPSHWQVFENNRFEVWPIPEANGHTLRFKGISRAKTLVNNSDVLDLDDDLVVMYTAAQILARNKSADAQVRLEEAKAHYRSLKANSQKAESFCMSDSSDREPVFRGINIEYAERRD